MFSERVFLLEALAREIHDSQVLEAMRRVPREAFVASRYRRLAYSDIPLPIGDGQTISQPLVVALMTQAAEVQAGDKVLEVGTGSGYQAAVLGEMAEIVISVERVPQLAERAQRLLGELHYTNIQVYLSGEELGWPAEAPYDVVVVSAAAPRIPSLLLDQLSEGGRMVIPVGGRTSQELLQVRKVEGHPEARSCGQCRFVPLVGPDAWSESHF